MLGSAIFQKKEEYGGAKATITGLAIVNVDLDHLVDLNSTLTVNGKHVIGKQTEVGDLFYGASLGKSSK
jgi:hypothetical protein